MLFSPSKLPVVPIQRAMRQAARLTVAVCALGASITTGCATNRNEWTADELRSVMMPPVIHPVTPAPSPVIPVGFQVPIAPAGEPTFGQELTTEAVIGVVLARNPTLDAMRAAAEVAAARYPQVTSLDDPSFSFNTAPGSAWSSNTDYAARVELSQKLPFPGKRELKGQVSTAEAAATSRDIDETRLILVAAAKSATADYYLAEKGTSVAQENVKLLREFRQNAETRYKTGVGPQQDMLQADVELARQEERLVSLRRARVVAGARLNTLMHLPPDRPLPPPAEIRKEVPAPDAAALRTIAARVRPELKAIADRLASDEAALALAIKEYNPDVDLMAAYDGFWQGQNGRPLQWQVGARVNLPVRYARRSGAVNEAQARVAQRRAELLRLADRVNFEVQEAAEQVRETEDIVKLYETKVLPAAEANVKEAQTAYVNGRLPFLNLVEAQRNRVGLKDRYFEVIAESVRRRAALERAVGEPIQETAAPR
jgi:cobalt-zinc-cadmium efflux system outer membrane protein